VRLGYFSMPLHPCDRPWAVTLQEDRHGVILADKLGFYDAFIGEHLTDQFETITNSLLFLGTLIPETTRIKLATGTSNLCHTHPVLLASHAAMFDHLSGGRFILGISPGALASDMEVLGLLDADRNQLFAESIDIILAVWAGEPPYDIELPGNRYRVSTTRTFDAERGTGYLHKPLQRPAPEIVGTVVAPFSKGAIAMGERDFHPLSANFLLPQWLPSHWQNYVKGRENAGAVASADDWRVARTIFVADDAATAAAYGKTDARSPYRFYYTQLMKKLITGGRGNLFKPDPAMSDDSVTVDNVLDELVIAGTAESVAEQILGLRQTVGDFGELVYAGVDWVDPALARRSMELMATEVMPRVNAAIAADPSDLALT
jgi:alkanesulfonate monooxygenase SsuD/methylene tetrahydromethanopterin reductase-like flavin-dependent oxidoreductase (luciferase family)